jgi:DNA primase
LNWVDYYREQVLPRLTVESAYADVAFTSRASSEWRGSCPLHGGDNPTAFRVDPKTLRWQCFTGCNNGGDLLAYLNGGTSPRGELFIQTVRKAAERIGLVPPTVVLPLSHPAPPRLSLVPTLAAFQKALPGSPGQRYLESRRIPLALAQEYGLGYAAPGRWPNRHRDWSEGRLVFPHKEPGGSLINLYGRAIDFLAVAPRELKHDHLRGEKGYFNAPVLIESSHVWICEGAFDALAAIASGYENSVAIFGLSGWRWPWASKIRSMVLAFDLDPAGQNGALRLAREGAMRGIEISLLHPEALGRYKDLSEAWAAGDPLPATK